MTVGIFSNTQFPAGDSVAARIPELVEQVRVAKQSGFASLLFPQHSLTDPLQMSQVTPLMAYLLPEVRSPGRSSAHQLSALAPDIQDMSC